MKISKILERAPWVEVVLRNIYWRTSFLHKFTSRQKANLEAYQARSDFDLDDLVSKLKGIGIKRDDVIIIHSSMHQFKRMGISAIDIINKLRNELCPEGTLVCPAFPLYPKEPKGVERITANISGETFLYDVQKSRPWTGELGSALMRIDGSRRSMHPLNSIIALGVHRDRIFSKEGPDRLDLPCGVNSSWKVLADMNAKILALGVDLAHSLTMIHVAEDCYENEWPIKNWYRSRVFQIKNGGNEWISKVRERQPRWSMSFAERKLSRDLFREKVAMKTYVGSLSISYTESATLLNFLNSKKTKGYPYYFTWLSRL